MPRFAVLLHGKDILVLRNGSAVRAGVYCWRCVEAASEGAAVPLAIAKLARDPLFREEVLDADDALRRIVAEEVDALAEAIDLDGGDSACVFYIDTCDCK